MTDSPAVPASTTEPSEYDVVVIGGGQAALAAGYYLRRTARSYVLLDDQPVAGGAWLHTWPSLHLFSPARHSSLPGWLMPDTAGYPPRDAAIAYLRDYEARYAIPVRRPVRVHETHVAEHRRRFRLHTSVGHIHADAVISATGSWSNPVWPELAGRETFRGRLIHSATYEGADAYRDKRVLVIGAGNSGAQIFADLLDVARVTWCVRDEPTFLPDHVDGQYLFEQGTARYKAIQEGRTPDPPRSLGDIVMVPPVRAARDAGRLIWSHLPQQLTPYGVRWPDGREEPIDAIICATGFKPSLAHLAPALTPNAKGRLDMTGLHAATQAHIYPLGYGDWTSFASATLIGVGRAAKAVVESIAAG
ncbi:MAG: NAD(P)-binding domain-containing protein [Gemmatimonadaceae bacterium]|nr:NAD(P)-binding domain-containing protein [Gemmatimonadaceae bacterium]